MEKTKKVSLIRYKGRCGLFLNGGNKTIIHFHGLGGNFYENRFIYKMIDSFSANNISFISINSKNHDKDEDYVEEIEDLKEFIEQFDNVILQGHSFGCLKVSYFIYKFKPKNVKATILLSPPDMNWIFKRYVFSQLWEEEIDDNKYYEITLDDYICIFKGNVIKRLFLYDGFQKWFYEENIPNKVLKNLPNVLCIFGRDDFCVRNVEIYCKKLKESGVTTKIIDGDHVYSKNEDKLVTVILDFIKNLYINNDR